MVNIYDDWIGRRHVYEGNRQEKRKVTEDVEWSEVITNRTVLVGDFNAHSLEWNSACLWRERVEIPEALLRDYDLIINNDTSILTRPIRTLGRSVIDLTLTTPDLGLVSAWNIDLDYSTPSDYELITFDLENIDQTQDGLGPGKEVIGWDVKDATIIQEEAAMCEWEDLKRDRSSITSTSIQIELGEEAEWVGELLTNILNRHFKLLRVCAGSKRWWSIDLKQSRAEFKFQRRLSQQREMPLEEYRIHRNANYWKIRRAKISVLKIWSKEIKRYTKN